MWRGAWASVAVGRQVYPTPARCTSTSPNPLPFVHMCSGRLPTRTCKRCGFGWHAAWLCVSWWRCGMRMWAPLTTWWALLRCVNADFFLPLPFRPCVLVCLCTVVAVWVAHACAPFRPGAQSQYRWCPGVVRSPSRPLLHPGSTHSLHRVCSPANMARPMLVPAVRWI